MPLPKSQNEESALTELLNNVQVSYVAIWKINEVSPRKLKEDCGTVITSFLQAVKQNIIIAEIKNILWFIKGRLKLLYNDLLSFTKLNHPQER